MTDSDSDTFHSCDEKEQADDGWGWDTDEPKLGEGEPQPSVAQHRKPLEEAQMDVEPALANDEAEPQPSVAQRRKLLEEAQNIKEPEPALSSDEASEPPHSPSPLSLGHLQNVGATAGFGGLFSSIVTGGLDVLETLGKKTYETLTVKDEADADRRRFLLRLTDNGQNLSDVLREVRARNEASEVAAPTANSDKAAAAVTFINQFERTQGMVHLEGLELISATQKERSGARATRRDYEEQLANFSVESISECSTEDFRYELRLCINGVYLPYNADNVLQLDDELCEQLHTKQLHVDAGEEIVVAEMHEAAIATIAKFTAHSIQALHKIAQLIVIAEKQPDAEAIFAFTFVLCRRLSFYASQYANLLSLTEQAKEVDEVVTNIFFECSNACHYVRKALVMLQPFFVV